MSPLPTSRLTIFQDEGKARRFPGYFWASFSVYLALSARLGGELEWG